MTTIAPSILQTTFEGFKSQAERIKNIFSYIQIDVMDGEFVNNKSFDEVEKINELKNDLQYELHLMVKRPLQELEKWEGVKKINRILFHIECDDDPMKVISAIRGKCYQVGIALNPETLLEKIKPYYQLANVIMFMTVHPGRQGAPFVPEVIKKIREFAAWSKRPLIAVDGAVNKENIKELARAGVEIFNIGSSLVMAPEIKLALEELNNALKIC